MGLGLLLSCCCWLASADNVVVIVHKENKNPVDLLWVQQMYLGAVRGWPDGTPAVVLDLPENEAIRNQFSQVVLGRSPANVRAIRTQNIFTGRGLPPRVVASDAEIKRLVSTQKNAIGYIFASQLDDSVSIVKP